MATTVAQHQVGAITDPAEGSTLSSAVMRGVSATLRTEINAHDADPGVHLQSSVAGSRPVAGTAGRKWLDTDTLLVKYDNGTSWDDLAYLKLATGGTVAGALTVSTGGLTVTAGGLTVSAGGASVTGNLTLAGGQINAVRYDAGNSSTAVTVNWNNGNVQRVRLTGNATLTFSNPVAGAMYTLEVLQDGTGSRTVTWPAAVLWDNGLTPTITTTANRKDVFVFLYNGTNYYGGTFAINLQDTN